jgi:hypothetical protein
MSIRSVSGTRQVFHLVCVDRSGDERRERGGDLASKALAQELAAEPYTDIFVLSHGWKGDVPAAVAQYDAWIASMLACTNDLERAHEVRPGFRPLFIGFHWPSLPWGNEDLGGAVVFAAESALQDASDVTVAETFVDTWADRIADTPEARIALRTIWDAAMQDIEPKQMPLEVVRAYKRLDAEAGLAADGVAGGPEADREEFDPVRAYEEERLDMQFEFGGALSAGLLSPLRQLSFWSMKARARRVGETGGYRLLQMIRCTAGPHARIHLMGHSFGCIVVSAMAAGPTPVDRVDVDSMFLVQGALSLWSYCEDIPYAPGSPGFFHRLLRGGIVRGPVVTTRSEFDSAVGTYYPKGAGIAGQVVMDAALERFPKYGAVGTFGIQGLGRAPSEGPMLPLDGTYDFQPGHVYNLDAGAYIRAGGGFSGAHNDIAHAEVAHAFWSAALR